MEARLNSVVGPSGNDSASPRRGRRLASAVARLGRVALTLAWALLPSAAHAQQCANPGNDGPGATQISVGASSGSATPIAAGDLLLVVQMQDATINSGNTSSYGDGVSGDPG